MTTYEYHDGPTTDAVKLQLKTFLDAGDELHAVIYPGSDTQPSDVQAILTRHQQADTDARANGAEVIYKRAVDPSTGETVGAARWVIWNQDKAYSQKPVDWVPPYDKAEQRYVEWAMRDYMDIRIKRIRGPHAILELLYVSSSARRGGVGKALTEFGTRRADELGLVCFVEATAIGQFVYSKCGFKPIEHVVRQPPAELATEAKGRSGMDFTFMKREVGGK